MWATQKTMAELFNVSKQNISYHIFKTGELEKNSTSAKIAHVQTGGNFQVKFIKLSVMRLICNFKF